MSIPILTALPHSSVKVLSADQVLDASLEGDGVGDIHGLVHKGVSFQFNANGVGMYEDGPFLAAQTRIFEGIASYHDILVGLVDTDARGWFIGTIVANLAINHRVEMSAEECGFPPLEHDTGLTVSLDYAVGDRVATIAMAERYSIVRIVDTDRINNQSVVHSPTEKDSAGVPA